MVGELGSLAASEQLITDLYVDLRRRINAWASVTKQTAQARMGYVGQHLVSIATGYPGGRSGARGRDLVMSATEFGEIKTCYRVDQLGKCNACGAATASIEQECSECGSHEIKRNDDSKWLISIQHDEDFASILDPLLYYLVLFDFTNMAKPDTVRCSIFSVNPLDPGFAFCMIDYYKNIRAASKSKAPYNLWPFLLKFHLMHPKLIYRSYILPNDKIETEIFPGRDEPSMLQDFQLLPYSRSTTLTPSKLVLFAERLGLAVELGTKKQMMASLDQQIAQSGLPVKQVLDALAYAAYWDAIEPHLENLPPRLKDRLSPLSLF